MEETTTSTLGIDALLVTYEECSSRGLVETARWLIELITSLDTETQTAVVRNREPDTLQYSLAKSLYDCGEYRRCNAQLRSGASSHPKHRFLRLYSMYLTGEKSREEASETVLGPSDGKLRNQDLPEILEELLDFDTAGECDTYLLYLLGVMYRQLDRVDEAIAVLTRATKMNEYNWAAWEELTKCMSSPAMINRVLSDLPDTLLSRMFQVVALLDLHASGDDIDELVQALESEVSTKNLFVQSLKAILAYNAQDFVGAQEIFDVVRLADPNRLEHMDIFSNVLFVLDDTTELAHLAKFVSEVDKFRPETCCVVGNYYSLQSDHEKAVTYFRKALKLNRSYLAAWTLMGHEYIELKNTHAAIESYRRAVDINKRDYRAWYGLGQAYEMLEMHYYALHYFQRAAALKPYDLRMWAAMGNCYEKLGRLPEAIKTYQRALLGDVDLDLGHLIKLGELYDRAGDLDAARKHFQAAADAGTAGRRLDAAPAQEWLDRHKE